MKSSDQPMQWNSFITFMWMELRRFRRFMGQSFFTPIITSFLFLIIFGIGLGRQIQVSQTGSYLEFIIPGLILMGMIHYNYLTPAMNLMVSKVFGNIEDLKTSPLSVHTIVWGMTTSTAFQGGLVAITIFLIGEGFTYIQSASFLYPKSFFFLFYIILSAGFSFSFIGFSIGITSKSFEFVNSISQFVVMPLIYLGGVFFSLDRFHPFWQKVAKVNPIFYHVNGLRYALQGESEVNPSLILIVTFLLFVFSYLVAIYTAKRGSYKHF